MTSGPLDDRALNRILLGRQGLLDPLDAPVTEVVEAIGAIQAQYWPAVGVALWTRMADLDASDLHAALEKRRLVMATLLRRTIHVVSAGEYPEYAAVGDADGGSEWRRTGDTSAAETRKQTTMRRKLLAWADEAPRSSDEITDWLEAWVDGHDGVVTAEEAEFQRQYKWRPIRSWSAFSRVPADGTWGTRTPGGYRTAPGRAAGDDLPDADDAVAEVVRRHLRAFGPAGPDDVAHWAKRRVPAMRKVFAALEDELDEVEGPDGRTLWDLPGAPRADRDADAPVRLLPWFDSAILALAPGHRTRLLPDEYRDEIFVRKNLQVKPTILLDGFVAGTWALENKGRKATLTLRPLAKLTKKDRTALTDTAERLAAFCRPDAGSHDVQVDAG